MAQLNIVKLAKQAAKTVPAYRALLNTHGISMQAIRGKNDFKKLPITDKSSYIHKHAMQDLFPAGKLPSIAYASSGSSGQPTFWFRTQKQEQTGGNIHETIVRDIFGIKKTDSTLVVVCFSMGVWIAGSFTNAAFQEVARRGYNITTITPGLEKQDILTILKQLAPKFKNVVLAGYPPFLMDVVHAAKNQNIAFNKNIFALTSGDKFSEKWRDDFMALTGIDRPEHIISLYGSADGGPLAFETPLTIFLRRQAASNKTIAKELFENPETLPSMFQYDESSVFFEAHNKELLITADTASPLIRYNIHDEGRIINASEVKDLLAQTLLLKEAQRKNLLRWQSPIIIKGGRSDVAVLLYALNIYPEHIQAGLEDEQIKKSVSGQYFAFNKNTHHHKHQKLCINIELAPSVAPSPKLRDKIKDRITARLLELNIEYRKLTGAIGNRALPVIRLFPYGKTSFSNSKTRGILSVKGKKTRIVL